MYDFVSERRIYVPDDKLLAFITQGYDDHEKVEFWTVQDVWDQTFNCEWSWYGEGLLLSDLVSASEYPYVDVLLKHHAFRAVRFKPKKIKNTREFLLERLREIGPFDEREDEE